jgi:diaminohydroxyphosphoribosylaminopyrimidine deaminase / 5-amino-6-(5-phosphoribosylamino)uracil reductase
VTDEARQALMRRAIAIAWTNFGRTRPNPVVGCVVARGETVLAEGVTGAGGRPHAEEQALAELGGTAQDADAYVTLEPCGARSSGGLSCSERLAAAGVRRVFVACEDASPHASGRGAERLQAAGVEVTVGCLRDEAAPLYAGYAHRLRTGRPLVDADARSVSEGLFSPVAGETLDAALLRYGAEGYSHLTVEPASELARALEEQGLLHRAR